MIKIALEIHFVLILCLVNMENIEAMRKGN